MVKLSWSFKKAFYSITQLTTSKKRSRAGNQGHKQNEWLDAQVNINVDSSFRIIFKTQRFLNFYGDIGIDDISLDSGVCEEPETFPSKFSKLIFQNS